MTWSIGVSTSMNSRLKKDSRSERMTVGRMRAFSRACGRMIRSTYRIRTRVSSDNGLCSTGSGRSAFAVICQAFASTESSPRLDVMTSPVTLTKSPISTTLFQLSSSSWPTLSRESMIWSSAPAPSRIVAKASLPVSRLKITRPTTLSTSPVATSIARSPNFERNCASEVVLGTATGYGWAPSSSNLVRFSRRIRNCSGRSSSTGVPTSLLIVEEITVRCSWRRPSEVQ
ncbi:hypothetical protein GALL_410500 [mine drainage metagenome]|uniref:Uncharacterized protein n=1 Tax=mine drainage metagenome TaxID=410659 RepID=A0A1J5QML8_9ZZZZ